MPTTVSGSAGVSQVQGGVGGVVNAAPAFSARLTTTQALSSGVDAIVVFPTEDFDTNGKYNNANGRFQPTVAGYYQVNACVNLNSDTLVTRASVSIIKNGTTNMGATNSAAVASAGTYESQAISNLIYLNGSTDYLEIWVNIIGTAPLYVYATAALISTFSAFLARAA